MYYRPQSLAMTVSNVVEPVPPLGGFSRRDPIFFCRDFPVKSSTDLFPDWDVYGHIIMSSVPTFTQYTHEMTFLFTQFSTNQIDLHQLMCWWAHKTYWTNIKCFYMFSKRCRGFKLKFYILYFYLGLLLWLLQNTLSLRRVVWVNRIIF